MKRFLLAAVALLLMALGMVAAVTSPVSAHAGDISVKAVCVDEDTVSATYTVGWNNGTQTGKLYQRSGIYGHQTGNNQDSTNGWTFVKDVTGKNGSTSFTITHEKSSFNGGNGPWWSSKVIFTDRYGVAADTRIEGFQWNKCKPVVPEKPEPITEDLSDSRTTCEAGVESRTGTKVTDWELKDNVWVKKAPVTTWNDWTFVRNLTNAEKVELGCTKPEKPESIVKPLTDSMTNCLGVQSRTGTETIDWAWSDKAWEWVKLDAVTVWNDWTVDRELTMVEQEELGCYKEPTDREVSEERESCELGYETRGGSITTTYEYIEGEWVGTDQETAWADWIAVPYTDDEWFEKCAPTKPEPIVTETSSSKYECGDAFETVTRVVTTTGHEWNAESREWVATEPVNETTVTTAPVEVVACPTEPPTPTDPPTATLPNTGMSSKTVGLGILATVLIGAGALLIRRKKSNA